MPVRASSPDSLPGALPAPQPATIQWINRDDGVTWMCVRWRMPASVLPPTAESYDWEAWMFVVVDRVYFFQMSDHLYFDQDDDSWFDVDSNFE